MPTGPAFGWTNGSAPFIDAANLEAAYAGGYRCNVDTPEAHGAARDGSTDDTAAIVSAINNVVTLGQSDGSNYGEVWFTTGQYAVKGALTQGGTTKGNAQIPLPVISTTGEKFTLVLRGVRDGSALPHWQQTSVQKSGVCLVSNISATYNATYGSPAMLGGPTSEQMGAGAFSNMLVVSDGLQVVTPLNTSGVAVDFQRVGQANIPSMALSASITPPTFSTFPTNASIGLRMPQIGNNDNNNVGVLSIEGYQIGLDINEHFTAQRVAIIYCKTGISFDSWSVDGAHIGYLSTEVCGSHISTASATSGGSNRCGLTIDRWDIEDGSGGTATTWHVDDASNFLAGVAWMQRYDGTTYGQVPLVNGAANYKVLNSFQAPGHVTSPSFPSSGAALQNPFWRDALVQVSGVTGLTVDGATVNLASGAATCLVPSGKSITPTYSSGEAWTWWLM